MDAKEFIVKSVKMCETHKRTCNLCPANVDIWEGCPFDFFIIVILRVKTC